MRLRLVLGLLPMMLGSVPAPAQEADRVVACESLLDLRILAVDPAGISGRPGCRMVARTAIGAVEHRAMVGGSPYECLAVQEAGRCLWVLP